MNTLGKILIGVGVVGAVAATTYIVTKRPVKKEEVIREVTEEGEPIVEETVVEDKSILEKIKDAAFKKAVKILAWAALHQQQIESAATLIGLASGVFSLINAVKDFNRGEQLRKDIDSILAHNDEFESIWNEHMNHSADRYETIMNKLNDIHLDMSIMHEIQEMLVTPKGRKTA